MTLRLLALLALVTPLPALAQPGIALTNPGLEADADKDGLPDGWSKHVRYFGQARTAVDAIQPHGGAAAVRVELGDKSRCALAQYLAVPAPGSYTFSVYVRAQAGCPAPAQVVVNWFKVIAWPGRLAWVKGESPIVLAPVPAEWTRISAVGTKPAGADLAQVAIIAGNGNTAGGTLFADDATFEPGSRPWPLVLNGGFEGDGNNDQLPDGWGKGGEGAGFELVRDTKEFHGGAAAARLTGLPGHGDRVCLSQMTPVFSTPARLRISFWYKGTGKADGIIDVLPPPDVKNKDGGVYYDRYNFTAPTPQPEWKQFVIERETTAEARAAGLMRLQPLLYQKGDGDLWYDDFTVELLD